MRKMIIRVSRLTLIMYLGVAMFSGFLLGACTTSKDEVKYNQNYAKAKVLVYCELITEKAGEIFYNKANYRPQTIYTVRLLLEEAHPICTAQEVPKDIPSALKIQGIYNQLLNKLNNSVNKQ